jgi:hypothetical protein
MSHSSLFDIRKAAPNDLETLVNLRLDFLQK